MEKYPVLKRCSVVLERMDMTPYMSSQDSAPQQPLTEQAVPQQPVAPQPRPQQPVPQPPRPRQPVAQQAKPHQPVAPQRRTQHLPRQQPRTFESMVLGAAGTSGQQPRATRAVALPRGMFYCFVLFKWDQVLFKFIQFCSPYSGNDHQSEKTRSSRCNIVCIFAVEQWRRGRRRPLRRDRWRRWWKRWWRRWWRRRQRHQTTSVSRWMGARMVAKKRDWRCVILQHDDSG